MLHSTRGVATSVELIYPQYSCFIRSSRSSHRSTGLLCLVGRNGTVDTFLAVTVAGWPAMYGISSTSFCVDGIDQIMTLLNEEDRKGQSLPRKKKGKQPYHYNNHPALSSGIQTHARRLIRTPSNPRSNLRRPAASCSRSRPRSLASRPTVSARPGRRRP